jgi:chaperone modulatory protein CbpM
MTSFESVLRQFGGLQASELEHWIEERWVLPVSEGGDYAFHEVDVARVGLIIDLRRELAIDEQALPVVLHLLDQIYALRRRLRALCTALEAQPEEVRAAVLALVTELPDADR